MIQYLKQLQERQQQQAMAQQQAQTPPPEQGVDVNAEADAMMEKNTPDIDELLANMPEEQRQQAMQNPQMLEQIIRQQMGV